MSRLLRYDESPLLSVIDSATAKSANGRELERHEQRVAYKRTDEYAHALDLLRSWLRPGDTVLTCVLSVSRSGRQRVVGAWAVNLPERDALVSALSAYRERGFASAGHEVSSLAHKALSRTEARPRTIKLFGYVAHVLNLRADVDRGGVVMRDGESGNELVQYLGRVLYGDARAFDNEEL